MGKAFLYGSGGGLNYAIKSYATNAALLADSPRNNTIGIVTATEFGRVAFASTEPTTIKGVTVASGDIWVKEGLSSGATIDIARKDEINIYPTAVYQYNGALWSVKTAYMRKNGAWIGLLGEAFIYNSGDECAAITGGYTAFTLSGGYAAPVMAKLSDRLSVLTPTWGEPNYGVATAGAYATANKIDVSSYGTLRVNATNVYPASAFKSFGLISTVQTPLSSCYSPVASKVVNSSDYHDLDISSISGEYYVAFWAGNSSANLVDAGMQVVSLQLLM